MMDLETEIKHCYKVAEENENRTKPYRSESVNAKLYETNKEEWDKCLECAEEHRQIAEWLTELKFYKMAFGKIEERVLGIVCYKGRIFKSFDDDLVLKTQDKNGMCSFYGFREVGENNDTSADS